MSLFAAPRDAYYQEILGILNRQFSEGVLSFDQAFKKKSQEVRRDYGRKTKQFKKLVNYYDEVKKKLYFQQNDATKVIRDYLKPYDAKDLKRIHLALSSFDKIFFPENYISNFYSKLQKEKRLVLTKGSLASRLKSYYELSTILNDLGFRSERKVNYALKLIVAKSKVNDMTKLEKVLRSMLFKSFFLKYKPFLINLEKRIIKYKKNLPY